MSAGWGVLMPCDFVRLTLVWVHGGSIPGLIERPILVRKDSISAIAPVNAQNPNIDGCYIWFEGTQGRVRDNFEELAAVLKR